MTAGPGDNGRDAATGRFLAGNRIGAGNAHHKRAAELRRLIGEAVEAELPDLVATLIQLAKGGDVQAARLLLDRAIGSPRPEPRLGLALELPEHLDLAGLAAASAAVVRGLAEGAPGEAAAPILDAIAEHRRSLEAAAVERLESRLEALENRLA